jgi:hypothetical protein
MGAKIKIHGRAAEISGGKWSSDDPRLTDMLQEWSAMIAGGPHAIGPQHGDPDIALAHKIAAMSDGEVISVDRTEAEDHPGRIY